MATNDMTFNQVAAVLNEVQQQATGWAGPAPVNTADFVTAATTTLKTGYDPVLKAINQVLTRTIFSVRPYNRKFGLVEVSESAYGNHIRKLSIADREVSEDDRYKWPVAYDANQNPADGDGQSVDQYILKKPKVLQTNFYGQNVFSDYYPIFRDQLDNAFTGPDQFASFLGIVTQNMSDKLEQCRENMGRACVANFIGGIVDEDNQFRVVHLLSEYNTLTGLDLTATDVYKPDNYAAFVRWAYAKILTVSDMMTERSMMYQTVVNNLPVMRHTPKDRQKMMIYAPASNMMTTMAVADTYHSELLRLGAYETVNFWQNIQEPAGIVGVFSRIGQNGSVISTPSDSPLAVTNIFGVIFDEEALGYATTQQWSSPTPFNARGGYSNVWLHETQRLWNDHSEKGVVFLLD